MGQTYMLLILYCQYHACWCPGDLSHQGISRNGIDQINLNILSLVYIRRVNVEEWYMLMFEKIKKSHQYTKG